MPREERTEVLVMGAGPVGMLTELLLAKRGVKARIIDQDSRTASRTYACALHPRSLELLEQLGLSRDVVEAGRQVKTVAFYDVTFGRYAEGFDQRQSGLAFRAQSGQPMIPLHAHSGLILEFRFKKMLEYALGQHDNIGEPGTEV